MNRLLGIMAISWIGGILGVGITYAGYVLLGKSLTIVSVLTLGFSVLRFIFLFVSDSRRKSDR